MNFFKSRRVMLIGELLLVFILLLVIGVIFFGREGSCSYNCQMIVRKDLINQYIGSVETYASRTGALKGVQSNISLPVLSTKDDILLVQRSGALLLVLDKGKAIIWLEPEIVGKSVLWSCTAYPENFDAAMRSHLKQCTR